MLVFSAFLFLNAELWQVAQDFTPLAFWVSVGLLVFVAGAFVALRIPREIAEIARFESWDGVCGLANRAGSPLVDRPPDVMQGRCDPALTRSDRFNVALVVLFNLGLQIILVSSAIGLFYIVFGVFAVRAETIVEWTSLTELGPGDVVASFDLAGTELVLTVELLRVVGFLAAFSSLQFSVAAVTGRRLSRGVLRGRDQGRSAGPWPSARSTSIGSSDPRVHHPERRVWSTDARTTA